MMFSHFLLFFAWPIVVVVERNMQLCAPGGYIVHLHNGL